MFLNMFLKTRVYFNIHSSAGPHVRSFKIHNSNTDSLVVYSTYSVSYTCFTANPRSVDKKSGSPQLRRLQVCRYEVAQCLHTVQIYMTHQVGLEHALSPQSYYSVVFDC